MMQSTTVLEIAETATPTAALKRATPETTEFCRRLFTRATAPPCRLNAGLARIWESVMRPESLQKTVAPLGKGSRRYSTITLLTVPPLITMDAPEAGTMEKKLVKLQFCIVPPTRTAPPEPPDPGRKLNPS